MGRRPCWGWRTALQEAGSRAGGPLGTSEVTPPQARDSALILQSRCRRGPVGPAEQLLLGNRSPGGLSEEQAGVPQLS